MTQQHIHTKKTSPWQGILLILELFAGFLAVVLLCSLLVRVTGIQYLAYGVYLAAIVAGVLLMRRRILEFRYTLDNGTLYIERLYGTQTRVLAQVPLRAVVAFGEEETVLAEYRDKAHSVTKVVLPACDIPHMALAYKSEGVWLVLVMQPDEAMRRAITEGRESVSDPFSA